MFYRAPPCIVSGLSTLSFFFLKEDDSSIARMRLAAISFTAGTPDVSSLASFPQPFCSLVKLPAYVNDEQLLQPHTQTVRHVHL